MFKFEKFEGWQRAMQFGRVLIKMTWKFPTSYQSWLEDQLRRAALSISTNLAEGSGRDMPRERARFYQIAKGSLYECVNLLIIAKAEGLVPDDLYLRFYNEAKRIAGIISVAIASIRRTASRKPNP